MDTSSLFEEPMDTSEAATEQSVEQATEDIEEQNTEQPMIEETTEQDIGDSGQTTEEGIGQTTEEDIGRTTEEGNGQTTEEGNGQTTEEGIGRTTEEGIGRTTEEGIGQTTEESTEQTTEQDTTLTDTTASTDLNQTATPSSERDKTDSAKVPIRSSKRGRPPGTSKPGQTPKRRPRPSDAASGASTGGNPDSVNEGELFGIILEGKSAIQSIVSDWVNNYQRDSEKAMLELIQYFVRCCGCRATISRNHFQTKEASTVIRTLTENFAEESGDYPLVLPGAVYRKFKVNFSEFVERLVSQCGDSILYDEYMLDTMVMWLVGLSDSQVRAFRHTSALACLKLVTGMVSVANSITQEADNTQRQYDTEQKKSVSKRASGKLAKLESKLQELHQQLTELHDNMNTLFSSVFVHRYRDIFSEIRSICIQELGIWMKEYHKQFLDDAYLKYIGWTLSDKVGEVRLQSVQALIPLYSSSELAPHVELFTEKFKERLVSMRLDKEDYVQIAAINLCGRLLSLDMLEVEECIEICEMVFMDTKKGVSQAAGAFANQYLFSEDFLSKERRNKPPKGHKKPTDAQLKIKELVRFFQEANIHQHTTYLVDSLWDHTEVLQDWETLVSMLIDPASGVVLSSEGEAVVIDMLAYSVKKASNVAATSGKGRGKAKDRRAVLAERESLASVLIPVLPELMAKYGTDVECAANLTSIPQHFDMEIYVEMRGQKHLEDLLDQLKQIVLKHSTDEVLHEIACTYKHLLSPDETLHSTVDIAFNQLTSELFDNCKQCIEAISKEDFDNTENEDVYNLSVTLKRIAALFKKIDLTKWDLTEKLLMLIEFGVDGIATDMIVIPALTIVHLHLLWSLHGVNEDQSDRSILRSIHSLLKSLTTQCRNLIKMGSQEEQKQAYMLLCDLLIVFSKHLKNKGPLGLLVYTPDSLLQALMCDFVMERVFREAEEDTEPTTDEEAYTYAEKLNERRFILAGFIKLLMYSVIDPIIGLPVYAQFVKCASDYGDLIKKALAQFKEMHPRKWHTITLSTLQYQYSKLVEEGEGKVEHKTAEWADLKDLARRFALTTGFDLVKHRLSIVSIHREGIRFALQDYDQSSGSPPPQLDFLEVLSEFSFRLLPFDKTGENGIIAFLNEQLGHSVVNTVKTNEEWKPLRSYLISLEKTPIGGVAGGVPGGGADDNEAETPTAGGTSSRKGGRGTKRKQQINERPGTKSLRVEAAED